MNLKNVQIRYASFICLFLLNALWCEGQTGSAVRTALEESYHPDIVAVSGSELIQGRENLKSYLDDIYTNHEAPAKFKSQYKVAVNKNLDYEIGLLQLSKKERLVQLIVWAKGKEVNQKIFEVVYEKTRDNKVPAEIAQAREKWIKLCNEHNVKKLVTELYTEDAIYFNRGRILQGREELTKEYGYMNQPLYNLVLNPEHVEVVDDETIFEIGRCSGSYPLPYILVWKKQTHGNWQIYIDSNY